MNSNAKSCYDMVRDAFAEIYAEKSDKITEQFGTLAEICELVDELADDFSENEDVAALDDAAKKTVRIDTDTLVLTISLVCFNLELPGGENHKFYRLIRMLDSFRFIKSPLSNEELDFLQIDFCVGMESLQRGKKIFAKSRELVEKEFVQICREKSCKISSRFDHLAEICTLVDKLAKSYEANKITADINQVTLDVTISLFCPYYYDIIEDIDGLGDDWGLFHEDTTLDKLAKLADSLQLSRDGSGLRIDFHIKDVFTESESR